MKSKSELSTKEKRVYIIDRVNMASNIERAVALSKEGKRYREISEIMGRPLGTIHRWLAPYKLTSEKQILSRVEAAAKGSKVMQANYKKKRDNAYETGMNEAEECFKDPMFRDFINLYIGEGSKRNRGGLQIINSDPYILFPSYVIMKKYFLKEEKDISLNIAYYEKSHNIEELKKFWGDIFKNESIKITTSIQPTVKAEGHNNSNKYGLVRLSIHDTYAKQRLDAYIDYLKASWMAALEKEVGCKVIMDKK